jgi:uncharacterized protein YndB with AHSA1/START domain
METQKSNESRLVYELFIRTTPEKVWQALTDADVTSRYFFGTRVRSSLERGSPFDYLMPDESLASSGTVVEVVPGKRLVHTWKIEYDPNLSDELSTITWLIEPRGAASKVTVMHDVAKAPKTAAHVGVGQDGWSVVLSGMKTLLETGTPLELPMSG